MIHVHVMRILATGTKAINTNGAIQTTRGISCGFAECGLGGTKIIVAANTISGKIIPMITIVAKSVLHSRSDVTCFGTHRNPCLSFTMRAKSMLATTTATKGGVKCSITLCRLDPSGMGLNDIINSPNQKSNAHASAKANSPRNTLSRALFLLFIGVWAQ